MINSHDDLYSTALLRRLKRQIEDLQSRREAADAIEADGASVRVLAHIASFVSSTESLCFLKVVNDSLRTSVQIEDVWFESTPIARVENPERPLPTILDPGELFETWKRLEELPAVSNLLTLGRVRLGDGSVVHAVANVDVPPAGSVGGGGRPLDEIHVDEGRANSPDPETWDVFISHATEDKSDVARPLSDALRGNGVTVWLDELTLGIGDSLRRNIDRGIARSAFAVVIVSRAYLAKPWTKYEFDGIITMTIDGKQGLLPIWHRITRDEVIEFSPTLADKVARNTATTTIAELCNEIGRRVRPDLFRD